MRMGLFLMGCGGTLVGEGTGIANNKGELEVVYSVTEETSLLLMAQSDQLLVVKEVRNPKGDILLSWDDWKQSTRSLSNGLILSRSDVVLNWPIREEDLPLTSGDWTFLLGSYDQEGYQHPDTSISVQFSTKKDNDLNLGVVRVWIVTTESVTEQIQRDLEDAVEGWKALWGNVGIELDIRYGLGFQDPLPLIYEGSEEIKTLRQQGEESELLVVVGESFDNAPDVLGFSGNVPGSTLPGPRSAIVISWLNNAGVDGEFDDEEIRLFSETLAHEAGHYLGLYHPVELEFSHWDALNDTEECNSMLLCQQNLKDNLMFPYPVCMGTSCIIQDQLSIQQSAVLHRNVGLR